MNIHSRLKITNCSVVISTVVSLKIYYISFENMFAMGWVYFQSNSALFVVCIFYIFIQSLCYMICQWMATFYYHLTCVWHERSALTLLKQSLFCIPSWKPCFNFVQWEKIYTDHWAGLICTKVNKLTVKI